MRYERTLLAVLFVLPRVLLGTDATEQGSPEPVQAIWKNQEFAFYFQSQTTFYSCSSLEAKLKRILNALGTRPNVRVRSIDCQQGPVRMPRVTVSVSAPVEATPQAIAERDKSKSTRELTARVRGEVEDPATLAPFPAQWKRVSLSRGAVNLEPGDCELMQGLQEKVLPKLSVKVLSDRIQCTPRHLDIATPDLKVAALVPLTDPDKAAARD
jgi:hypothetical protein